MKPTEFILINDWKEDVTVFLTLEVSEGYVSEISQLPFIKNRINQYQGSFTLAPQKFVHYTSPKSLAFCAKVSFNSLPINCPTPSFPSGVNVAEFTLNNHQDLPKTYESTCISNVTGANALMKFTLVGGGDWTAGHNQPKVTDFKNGPLGKNVGNVGVYPFACDLGTASIAPPYCAIKPLGAPNKPTPQKEAISNVIRPSSHAGGMVALSYLAPIKVLAEKN